MNPSKLYVPNPQKWVTFFDRVSKGQTSLNQSGGARRPHVIAVDSSDGGKQTVTHLPLKAVSPAEQTVQQAKSELERQNIKPSAVVDMIQKPKRRRQRRVGKSGKIKKIGGRQKGGAKKVKRKAVKLKDVIKSIKQRSKKK